MAVGSGSIKRVQKAATQIQGEVPEVAAETKKTVVKEAASKKAPAKKATPKKTAAKSVASDKTKETKKTATKKAVKKDDIHEKKYEAISNISCDLPYYLL